ncbi:MAG: hypothetical protein GF344_13825, partial [Chitinivibrionales bacterium]|nr:hypothetical protein [Chitinivibrionales bacterium]
MTLRILEGYERGFMELGHNVMTLSHDMQNYSRAQAYGIAKRFLDFGAHIAVCYGFSAMPEIGGSFFFRKRGIPLVVLCFENPFFGLNEKIVSEINNFPDYYYFFVWDRVYLDLMRSHVKHCYPIRHATQVSKKTDSGEIGGDKFQ